MKIKNVKQTLLIFLSLIILSFSFYSYAEENSTADKNIFLDSDQDGLSDEEEKIYGTDPQNSDTDGDSYSDGVEVKTGYDPLKPAPGDKIVQVENKPFSAPSPAVLGVSDENNLTQKISEKISSLVEENQSASPDSSADPSSLNVTVEEAQNAISEIIDQNVAEDLLPDISLSEIKIKKQNYSKLPADEATDRRREDFAIYLSAVSSVIFNNTPTPIASGDDLLSTIQSFSNDLNQALTSRDSSALNDWENSVDKILSQLKEVEVPEELADVHIQALRVLMHTKNIKSYINPRANDPMGDMANYSKISNFIDSVSIFSDEVSKKLDSLGLSFDDDMQQRLKTQGMITLE